MGYLEKIREIGLCCDCKNHRDDLRSHMWFHHSIKYTISDPNYSVVMQNTQNGINKKPECFFESRYMCELLQSNASFCF